jgi:uncharacterized protein (TIGR02687 family)
MNEQVQKSLLKKFNKYRIVFWYDPEKELRADFEAMELPGIEKVEIANNEFGLKYRLLRDEPETRFLLYKEGPQPEDVENWLLDVQLAHGEFRTDQTSLWAAELELGYEFSDVITQHKPFFTARSRRDALKKHLTPHDTPAEVRVKMLAVCCGSDGRIDSVLEHLLADFARADGEETESGKLLQRADLNTFLWERVQRAYGYTSPNPGVKDFVIELFKSCYAMEVGGEKQLTNEATVFLKHWKDSQMHGEVFETLSAQCAEILAIERDLEQRDYRDVLDTDYFELIDRKVLSELADHIHNSTLSAGECSQAIRQRRTSRWYGKYRHAYEAIDHGGQFLHALKQTKVEIESLEQGLTAYVATHYRIDQLYRKFIYHNRQAPEATLLKPLAEEIRRHYTNTFLRPLGDQWQRQVDALVSWEIPRAIHQHQFFTRWVSKFRDKKQRIVVVISDALRFEAGEELVSRIRQENRYEAELDHAITKLPSYTQLGMAALLPHKQLEINDDATAVVAVDGKSSSGIANREKILVEADQGRARALQAEELLAMPGGECRDLVRDHDLIYVYHNRIDKVGDDRDTEKRAFEAVEETLEELVTIVKKLASGNASNILITADHGFLYQDEKVAEADFSVAHPKGDTVLTHRRFILGRNMQEVDGVKKFSAGQLGLAGDLEVLVPKSINRFRKSGSGSRFMHGGCTLQEIVVPVIQVNKSRTSDVSQVEIDLLPSSSDVISTGQLSVAFYQQQAVTDKLRPRTLRVGIYGPGGELLSDRHTICFDASSENPRERETKVKLVLSRQAGDFNDQEVTLRLDEPVAETTHFTDYKSVSYTLRRSFMSDFD